MRRARLQKGVLLAAYAAALLLGARVIFSSSFFHVADHDPHAEQLVKNADPHQHPETFQSPMPEPPLPETTARPTTPPPPTLRALGKPVVNIDEFVSQPPPLAEVATFPEEGPVSRRVVHLDLKGAPMRPAYFAQLFPLLKSLGATGLLMEWEDMFPFRGRLSIAVNGFAYSRADIKAILTHAKESGLEVIPLVQTFGHLEWILKIPEFAHLRETHKYPQVACVGKELAWDLIKEAMLEVAEAHAEVAPVPYFHIGADEIFQAGNCAEDRQLMTQHRGKQRFILWHIARTARFIRNKVGARVLAWHDMFANSPPSDLKEYGMVDLVEPVNWNYAENLDHYMPHNIWKSLATFSHVWGASAYKGADGPARWWANIPHYHANHVAWLQQITKARTAGIRDFRGIILTGWSRYDHLSCLAELFPVGFPSLALNLDLLRHGAAGLPRIPQSRRNRNSSLARPKTLQDILGCHLTSTTNLVSGCRFPGVEIYEQVMNLKVAIFSLHNGLYQEHEFQGWLSRVAVRHNVSSAWYLEKVMPKVQGQLSAFQRLHRDLERELGKVFFPHTVTEWLETFAEKERDELATLTRTAEAVMARDSFPLRPFPLLPQTDTQTLQ